MIVADILLTQHIPRVQSNVCGTSANTSYKRGLGDTDIRKQDQKEGHIQTLDIRSL